MAAPGRFPGDENVSNEIRVKASSLREMHDTTGERTWNFEKFISHGSSGFTMKLKYADGKNSTSFVGKWGITDKEDAKIAKEIETLTLLRGGDNIQQLFRAPGSTANFNAPHIRGTALFSEWIGNGIIRDFVSRRDTWKHPLPNRMLWKFFFCLCKMVAVMAWPASGGRRGRILPQGGGLPPMSGIIHGDFNIQNVMIGDFGDQEHSTIPMLKLIDFGRFQETDDSDYAVKRNLYDIACIMLHLIGVFPTNTPGMIEAIYQDGKKVVRSRGKDLDGQNPMYNEYKSWILNLDPDLRGLLASCMAVRQDQKPDFVWLAGQVEYYYRNKKASDYTSYQWKDNESDEALRRISKRLILRIEPSGPWA
ncbi:hypothetical protein M426DRAFT_25197 [Hypoxylon sp. CI-4A]|nr:hypothetical protein M426DRAFT_25197 [Hypoxylon sp. CI-4A]